jgi:hypothetical protein
MGEEGRTEGSKMPGSLCAVRLAVPDRLEVKPTIAGASDGMGGRCGEHLGKTTGHICSSRLIDGVGWPAGRWILRRAQGEAPAS